MRKNKPFIKIIKTISLTSLLCMAVISTNNKLLNKDDAWFTTTTKALSVIAYKEILTGRYLPLGFLWGEENTFFYEIKEPVLQSAYPFSLPENILYPESEIIKGMMEENREVKEKEEDENTTKEEMFLTETGKFTPVTDKEYEIDWSAYQTTEALVSAFYTVDSTTTASPDLLIPSELINMNLSIDKDSPSPQILLYHTHSQESFSDSIPGNKEDSIIGAGEVLATLLREYGYTVLHHQGEYDIESRDQAYNESLPEITKILEENPQIQVVIDLHRDAVAEDVKLVTEIQDKPVAKVMFFNGLSYSRQQGAISYLENPYLKENLAFSLQMKAACDEYYPGFARNIYLRAYRYNMHLAPRTLLIELGAQTNTVEEIKNALYPLAHALDIVLSQ